MKPTRIVAAAALAAIVAPLAVANPVFADGAASTRNILIGGAAATLIILNHNKKVHERYAEDARNQAALAAQRDDARSAYNSEKRAYEQEAALVAELKKEVATQHNIIVQQRKQLSAVGGERPGFAKAAVVTSPGAPAAKPATVVAYGWGKY